MTTAAELDIVVKMRSEGIQQGANKVKKELGTIDDTAKKTTDSVSKIGKKGEGFARIFGTFSPRVKKVTKDIGGLTSALGEGVGMSSALGLALKGAVAGVVVAGAIAELKKLYSAMGELAAFASPKEYQEASLRLEQSVANFKQVVGTLVTPAFVAFTEYLSRAVDKLTEASVSVLKLSVSLSSLMGQDNPFEDLSSSIESASAGMAGFDKVNTLGTGGLASDLETAQKIKDAMQGSKNIAEDLVRSAQPLTKVFGGSMAFMNVDPRIYGAIADQITGAVSSAFDYITKGRLIADIVLAFANLRSKVEEVFGGIGDTLGGFFKGIANGFIGVINKVVSAYNSTVGNFRVDNDFLNVHIGFPKLSELPQLANGGIVSANNPMPVIVGDNRRSKEAIAPLDTLQTYINRAVDTAISSARQSIEISAPIEVTVDGQALARTMFRYNQSESDRRRTNLNKAIQ